METEEKSLVTVESSPVRLEAPASYPSHSHKMARVKRLPLWLKIGWTLWLIVWVPVYWRQYGVQNFLFFCDIGNVLIGVGLWLESSLIFSWVACGLLSFQSLFTIDLAAAVLTRHHLMGGTEYMFDPHLSLFIRSLSLFHVVTPPLLLWMIWRLGYNSQGWKLQTLATWIVVPVNYFWHPEQDVNWARGPFFHEQHLLPGWAYLLGYLVVVPLCIYLPTHLFLKSLSSWWKRSSAGTLY